MKKEIPAVTKGLRAVCRSLLIVPMLLVAPAAVTATGQACQPASVAHSAELPHAHIPELEAPIDPLDVARTRPATTPGPLAPVDIPVWFHVITDGAQGQITDAAINAQTKVLNDSFSGATGGATSPFSFTLAGVDRTDNGRWFRMAPFSESETEATRALRKGDARTLNVYIADVHYFRDGQKRRVSYATFPWSYKWDPDRDGIFLNALHVLGAGALIHPEEKSLGTASLSLGDVAVHEVGHWLGLYHTFQGFWEDSTGKQLSSGCTGYGDYVDDTPAEDRPGICEEGLDTCSSDGTDPIHNFMDYTGDVCKTEFSAGQVVRMEQKWTEYRAATPGRGNGRGGKRR